MILKKRWKVKDRFGNHIYLTQERWEHVIEAINHPEMSNYEKHLKKTIQSGKRKQDPLNPQKYRYSSLFDDLEVYNTHIVAIVLFRFKEGANGELESNNYIVTAYQKQIG